MYAVIFKAEVNTFDDDYLKLAKILRDLAFEKYNCQGFEAVTEGNKEIAISYWLNEEDIHNWRKDSRHITAQEMGKKRWYSNYSVDVVRVTRHYKFGS